MYIAFPIYTGLCGYGFPPFLKTTFDSSQFSRQNRQFHKLVDATLKMTS